MPMKIGWSQVDKSINHATMGADGQVKSSLEIPTVRNISTFKEWDHKRFVCLLGSPEFPASALTQAREEARREAADEFCIDGCWVMTDKKDRLKCACRDDCPRRAAILGHKKGE